MSFERKAYRALSVLGYVKTARRGIGPLVKRRVRAKTIGSFSRSLRRILKP